MALINKIEEYKEIAKEAKIPFNPKHAEAYIRGRSFGAQRINLLAEIKKHIKQ